MSVSWRVDWRDGTESPTQPPRAWTQTARAQHIRDETAGVGNGSTFQQIAVIFDKSLAPPVLGWSSAIASFGALLAARAHLRPVRDECDASHVGAFLIPKFFATAIQQGAPETPFFIFGAYYFTCIVVNWWFYLRIHPNSIKPGTAPQSAKE